jgi:hypothetical protein
MDRAFTQTIVSAQHFRNVFRPSLASPLAHHVDNPICVLIQERGISRWWSL